MIPLTELDPSWVGMSAGDREGIGISFECPCLSGECLRVFVAFKNPLDGKEPLHDERALWQRSGDTFETLTLRPSIRRHKIPDEDGHFANCDWHGYVTAGKVTTC